MSNRLASSVGLALIEPIFFVVVLCAKKSSEIHAGKKAIGVKAAAPP
jgi:hypothetical protein